MKFGIFVLLVVFAAFGNCASIVGHGTEVLGHIVPVKCTLNCKTAESSVGPVVSSPLINALYRTGPLKPADTSNAPGAGDDSSEETVVAPADASSAATADASSAATADASSAATAAYHKGVYAGRGPFGHDGVWGHHDLYGHWGPWNYGHWGDWNHGDLRDWDYGHLGDWDNGHWGDWDHGHWGDWDHRHLGDWGHGHIGDLDHIHWGDWDHGHLGDWDHGHLGDLDHGHWGDWDHGHWGDWDHGHIGELVHGHWGDWNDGHLGDWDHVHLGDWDNGHLGDLDHGHLGDWDHRHLGDWDNGHWGDWNDGHLGPLDHVHWGPLDHGHWGDSDHGHRGWDHGDWGYDGVVAYPVVDHLDYATHGHGGYATGRVGVIGDGSSYTQPEDDRSPIAGRHVYHSFKGEAKWHGPYHGAVAHAPIGGYGAHQTWGQYAHYPRGYLGHHDDVHAAVTTAQGGEEQNGPIFPYGHFANGHGNPWAARYPVTSGWHHTPSAYTIGELKDLEVKKKDCSEETHDFPYLVFDKSVKPIEAEAVPVADGTAKAAPAS